MSYIAMRFVLPPQFVRPDAPRVIEGISHDHDPDTLYAKGGAAFSISAMTSVGWIRADDVDLQFFTLTPEPTEGTDMPVTDQPLDQIPYDREGAIPASRPTVTVADLGTPLATAFEITSIRREQLSRDRKRLTLDHSIILHRDSASLADIREMCSLLEDAGVPDAATVKFDAGGEHTRAYARWAEEIR